ncbi:MarR family transcriptional regulator [Kitasatospora purpeofusca]|uniref:MarR family transcriptional regulator n=1 Tax=Kitasatospora purpeofusca TaxID=67352 RepID=UPI0035DC718D
MTTAPARIPRAAMWFNSMFFEYLPNAGLTPTERDLLDILLSRQEPGGVVFITQKQLGKRLGIQQPNVSAGLAGLAERGIIDPPELRRRGRVRLHKTLAAYEGPLQAITAINDPNIPDWPLTIPMDETRPARSATGAPAKADETTVGEDQTGPTNDAGAETTPAPRTTKAERSARPRLVEAETAPAPKTTRAKRPRHPRLVEAESAGDSVVEAEPVRPGRPQLRVV